MPSAERRQFVSELHGPLTYRSWGGASQGEETPRGVVVFLHGWGDHGGHYEELAWRLFAGGFACLAPDFYGHGLSPGPRARVHDFQRLIHDLDTFLCATHPLAQVYLCGHSMGGALAAHYAIRHPGRVAGVIFNSAALAVNRSVPRLRRRLCLLAGKLWPSLPMGRIKEPRHMARSLASQQAFLDDSLIHHGGIDAGTGRSLLQAALWIEQHGQLLATPFLALQGLKDELVSPDGPRLLASRASARGTLLEFPDARHDLLLDLGVDMLASTMLRWLAGQTAAPAGAE